VIVSIHQPDLLPYSGFWFKMVNSDVFVLAVHDQFQKHGYQRRVRMRDTWVSHQLVGKPALVPIRTIAIQPGWQGRLVDSIKGRYSGSKHWKDRGVELCARIDAASGPTLVEANCALIGIVRDLLDIRTPLVVTDPPTRSGTDRLIEQVKLVGGTAYLSGSGGAAYMGGEAGRRFADEGIELSWSRHQHLTGDSIVTVLMDLDDPMAAIANTASVPASVPASAPTAGGPSR
jgi:hypothetical protein